MMIIKALKYYLLNLLNYYENMVLYISVLINIEFIGIINSIIMYILM